MSALWNLLLLALSSSAFADDTLPLPKKLEGKAVVLSPADPAYPRAVVDAAVKNPGLGGISQGIVVRLTRDVPVYRLWSGPDQKDSRGYTNRVGQWWSYDAPTGSQQAYRADYEICEQWNQLSWVATCTLKKGAVVAIGPGQSVWAETCADPTGKEAFSANAEDWQVWVSTAWTRMDKELVCPDETRDYKADPANIAKPAP